MPFYAYETGANMMKDILLDMWFFSKRILSTADDVE